ncbi:MAG: DUF2807 domain-containing protein [Bacteroidetes bacterium]|nr:DUF2807 domain-containing protein [Bacteroidota bacterium]
MLTVKFYPMRIPFTTVMLLLGTFTLPAQDREKDPMARDRDLSGFDRIEVKNGIDLFLVEDDRETVAVSARETEARDRIVTRVSNGTLFIYYDLKGGFRWPLNMKLKAYVSFRDLKGLSASGACNVFVEGRIRAENFRLQLSGASDFTGAIEAGGLDIEQSGSSDCALRGKARILKLDISGASETKAFDLQAQEAAVKVGGASDVFLTVSGTLDASASGASDIRYKGKGVIKSIQSGTASSVKKVD